MFSLNHFVTKYSKFISLALVFTFMSANTQAKSPQLTVFKASHESVENDQLVTQNIGEKQSAYLPSYSVTITEYNYTGECPGKEKEYVNVWFVSRTTPPKKKRRVRITNISRGIANDPFPYTDRGYSGRTSERFDATIGKGHDKRYFILKRGENLLKYEIREKNTVIEEGQFKVNVNTERQVLQRNKQPFFGSEECVNLLRPIFVDGRVGLPPYTDAKRYVWRK